MADAPVVSVIIPTLNEEQSILACLESAREADERIVVDCGSADQTVQRARTAGATVVMAEQGRGPQMNAGARKARGDVLVFLHADTILPQGGISLLRHVFSDEDVLIRVFRSRFDDDSPVMRLYSFFSRFGSRFTTFGDQCIVVRRSSFERVGGFPNWPLFEDLRFLERMRKGTEIRKLGLEVTTSARKFVRDGRIRRQLRNCWCLLLYWCGVSPQWLAKAYYANTGAGSAVPHPGPSQTT
jgi:rSAM/selenodomain-associated transferase 2